jgi:hypothetical protein
MLKRFLFTTQCGAWLCCWFEARGIALIDAEDAQTWRNAKNEA